MCGLLAAAFRLLLLRHVVRNVAQLMDDFSSASSTSSALSSDEGEAALSPDGGAKKGAGAALSPDGGAKKGAGAECTLGGLAHLDLDAIVSDADSQSIFSCMSGFHRSVGMSF